MDWDDGDGGSKWQYEKMTDLARLDLAIRAV